MATNFLQRWSTRKLKAKEEKATGNYDVDALSTASSTDEAITQTAEPLCHSNDEEAGIGHSDDASSSTLAVSEEGGSKNEEPQLTFADVARVSFDSGVTSFMKEGVERSVKKAALRKLFHSDEFNYVSDMDDHTEDFSNIPTLDSNVTKQLRHWVNEAAEKVDELLTDASSTERAVANYDIDQIESGVELPDTLTHYDDDKYKMVEASLFGNDMDALAITQANSSSSAALTTNDN
ncbi:DUF3306 domain-containing protein [Photobacterium makurazakiensis]|uniref:DUF3306 domain-containing protein n=1 Tax=Photobacterium makurazakiensis TaxID=2910234 RepID=UPI003D117CBB